MSLKFILNVLQQSCFVLFLLPVDTNICCPGFCLLGVVELSLIQVTKRFLHRDDLPLSDFCQL